MGLKAYAGQKKSFKLIILQESVGTWADCNAWNDHYRLFVLPNDLFPGYDKFAPVAEETTYTFPAHLKLLSAFRAKRIRIEFIIRGISVAALTEKSGTFRG